MTVSRESARRAVAVLKAALRAGWLGTGDLAIEACLIVTFFEREAGVSDETRARGLVGRVLDAAGGGHPNTAAVDFVLEAIRNVRDEATGHERKWRDYEQEFILPQFEWAASVGIDLRKLVAENPGKNCSRLLFEAMQARVAELERQLALARMHPAEANLTVACLEYAAMLQKEGGAR